MASAKSNGASQVALMVKNPSVNAGEIRNMGWIPGLGKSPGGEHGNPPQYTCLENPKERGVWWAIVPRVAKCQTSSLKCRMLPPKSMMSTECGCFYINDRRCKV